MGRDDAAEGDAADEAQRLRAYLADLGASKAEAAEALAVGNVGGMALDLALRGDRPATPFGEAADRLGLPFEDAARFWRALGFPDPTPASPQLPPDAVEALSLVVTAGRELLGDDAALSLARVIGQSASRVAQAVVDAFRVQFETRELASGTTYPEVVERYVELAKTTLPPFVDALGAVLLRHLVNVASGAWRADAEGSTAQRDALVGFVDLVGYTALSQTLRSSELARLIGEFEELVTETTVRHRGRVVKLIGDAALFVVDDAATGCRIALDVLAAAEAGNRLPLLRAGVAAGEVMTLHGDVFGDVVNLAARLVAVAPEGGVLASDEVRRRAEATDGAGAARLAFEPLAPQSLKGVGAPATAFVVRPAQVPL